MPLTEAEIKGRENERELWKEATVTRNEAKKATRRTECMGKKQWKINMQQLEKRTMYPVTNVDNFSQSTLSSLRCEKNRD